MYELENKLISMNKSLVNKISSNSKWEKITNNNDLILFIFSHANMQSSIHAILYN